MSDTAITPPTNIINQPTAKLGRPAGRPKGKRSQLGMSLKNRLKTLKELIENPNTKDSDRVLAVKLMTELLSDKLIVDKGKEADTYMIKFEEIGNNTLDNTNEAVNVPANTATNIDAKEAINKDELNEKMLEVPANEGLIKNKMISKAEDVMLNSKSQSNMFNNTNTPATDDPNLF